MYRNIHSLTGLRFVAAFLVVLHHFGNPPSPQLVHTVLSHGFIAVTLFFILSGFILTYTYSDGKGHLNTSHWNFLVGRFARIYPVYLIGLLIYAPFAISSISAATPAHTSPSGEVAFYGAAALSLAQSWSSRAVLMWNAPAWSLSTEAFFYLVFPLVAPFFMRLKTRQLLIAGGVLWIVSLAGPAAQLVHADYDRNFWMFHPLVRLPEFLLGVVLGSYWLSGTHETLEKYSPHISVAAIAALLAFMALDIRESLFLNGATAPLMMALIISLATGHGTVARLLAARPVVRLGHASYSLYILHWPLWFAITWFLLNGVQRFGTGLAHILICLASIVGASLLCFRYVEQPANHWLKNMLRGRLVDPAGIAVEWVRRVLHIPAATALTGESPEAK